MQLIATVLSPMFSEVNAIKAIENAKVSGALKLVAEGKEKLEKLQTKIKKKADKASKKAAKLSAKVNGMSFGSIYDEMPTIDQLNKTLARPGDSRQVGVVVDVTKDRCKVIYDEFVHNTALGLTDPFESLLFQKVASGDPINDSEDSYLQKVLYGAGDTPFKKAIQELFTIGRGGLVETVWKRIVSSPRGDTSSNDQGPQAVVRVEGGVIHVDDAQTAGTHQDMPTRPVEIKADSKVDLSSVTVHVVEEEPTGTVSEAPASEAALETPMQVAFSNANRTKVHRRRGSQDLEK